MEQIVVDDENKKGIYEHIQSSIGYYSEYKKEIEEFFSTGILDKDLATRILENLIYSCKNLKMIEAMLMKYSIKFQREKIFMKMAN